MNVYFLLAFGFVSVLTFVVSLILSRSNYYERFKMQFHFRNTFPYELNYNMRFKDNLFGNLCYVFSLVMLFIIGIGFNKKPNDIVMIFIMISLFMVVLSNGLLMFIPLKYLKIHLASVILTFVSSFCLASLICTQSFRIYQESKDVFSLFALVVSALVALLIFILIMNPKLSKWAELENKTSSNGTSGYVRPKYFVLAFSEWILIFTSYINLVALLLLLFAY